MPLLAYITENEKKKNQGLEITSKCLEVFERELLKFGLWNDGFGLCMCFLFVWMMMMRFKDEQQYLFVKPTLPGHLSVGVAPHGVGALPKRGGSLGCVHALLGESWRSVYIITLTVNTHTHILGNR